MNINLVKAIGGVVGYVVICWVLFLVFTPRELLFIILIPLCVSICYMIRTVEWVEESTFSIFGVSVYSTRRVKQQHRLFGVVPVSAVRSMEVEKSLFKHLSIGHVRRGILVVGEMLVNLLPIIELLNGRLGVKAHKLR